MLQASYCGYPLSLAAAGKAIGLPEDKQKLTTGKALIRYFCVPCKPTKANGGRTRNLPKHDPEKWELFKEYNKQDVVTEMTIMHTLRDMPVPDTVQKQWETDVKINARGVAVDLALVCGAIDIGERETAALKAEAVQLTGLDNPNSVQQLTGWVAAQTGTEIPNMRKDTVKELQQRDNPDNVQRMLELRQELGKTSTKKYNAICNCICTDNRVRGLLQFYGANRTGRWAGRLVQVQNLPRTYTDPLPLARDLVKARSLDGIRAVYGSVNDTLSQLIRTAFVASSGNILIDADFSAIEARVISWLAGEQWRLDVFRTHGKIYEASASQMFGVPIDRIKKGNPEYALRAKGKVAELALGYQGGTSALIAMGALQMGLKEDELPDIVQRWRDSNPNISSLWWSFNNAAIQTINDGRTRNVKCCTFALEHTVSGRYLTIALPSGRKLYYVDPAIGTNRFGGASITYKGINDKNQFGTIETYGGRLVENCLSGDTRVLTNNGVKALKDVTTNDKLWDGAEWVKHDGVVCKGVQPVVCVNGVTMTPDHKYLTQRGWENASQSTGYKRHEKRAYNRYKIRGFRRQKIALVNALRLRKRIYFARHGIFKRQNQILRLHENKIHFGKAQKARFIKNAVLDCVAFDVRTLHKPECAGVEELRRQGYKSVFRVAQFRELPCRYGTDVQKGLDTRPNRRKRQLLQIKLPLGHGERTISKQKKYVIHRNPARTYESCRSRGNIGNKLYNITVPSGAQLADRFIISKALHTEQAVYDIMNAGRRHRFAVMSDRGVMIVHNCVQAIARDCLAEVIERLEAAGYPIVFHIHDEVVIDTAPLPHRTLEDVIAIMSQPIPWAQGLPLAADGWTGSFFKKE
jgi:DNA polymerase